MYIYLSSSCFKVLSVLFAFCDLNNQLCLYLYLHLYYHYSFLRGFRKTILYSVIWNSEKKKKKKTHYKGGIMIICLPFFLFLDARHKYKSKNGWKSELSRFLIRSIKILLRDKFVLEI